MGFGKLILLLMAALLVQQAQCLAACAVETCEQSLPPCHRHHGDQPKDHAALCLHHAVKAEASQHSIFDLPSDGVPPWNDSRLVCASDEPLTIAASPPGPPTSVLRI